MTQKHTTYINDIYIVYKYIIVMLPVGTYSGTAGDDGRGLSPNNGMKFTTIDRDNDVLNGDVCSARNDGRIFCGFGLMTVVMFI